MDFEDTPEESEFRQQARAWLTAHARPLATAFGAGTGDGTGGDVGVEHEDHVEACKRWQRTLFEGGWAGLSWPSQFGGRGLDPMRVSIFHQEHAAFNESTGIFTVALGMVGPTLIAHGTDAQKERFLAPMLRGEEVWCQLFSEPGAGSDLASLSTRAVLDGDEWVVNGQKVWTSGAHYSQYGILLARTNPDVAKHKGLTFFVVDMSTPGIEVRPLRQITGAAHFNEVFLNDVRIPAENIVGQVNEGWRVAMTTLTSERGAIGAVRQGLTFDETVELARGRGLATDLTVRQELAKAYIRKELLRFFALRMQSALSKGRMPGAEASVVKLLYSQNCASTGDLLQMIAGPQGMLLDYNDLEASPGQAYFLSNWASRLGGGTDEVQRNIVGERALGLPREPDASKDLPWSALPKS